MSGVMDITNPFVEEVSKYPEQQSQLKEHYYQALNIHFVEMKTSSKGRLSADILRDAELVYDLWGAPSVIAKALGIKLFDLQQALGRRRAIKCRHCGVGSVEVFEMRVKHGYQDKSGTKCSVCLNNEKVRRELEHDEWQFKYYQKTIIDNEISIKTLHDAASLKLVRSHLMDYLDTWQRGALHHHQGHTIFLNNWGDRRGCMICGCQPISLFIRNDSERLYEDPTFIELIKQFDENDTRHIYQHHADIKNYLHLLWRMWPDFYFSKVILSPLIKLPLAFLCKKHASILKDTHINPYQERYSAS